MKKLYIALTLMAGALLSTQAGKAQVLLSESFDGTTFPPTGWTTQTFANSTGSNVTYDWGRATNGMTSPYYLYPSGVAPHSGAAYAVWKSFSNQSGTSSDLITPVLNFNYAGGLNEVRCWIYRDDNSSYAGYANEGIGIYVSTTASSATATQLGFIPRSTTQSPSVTAAGWYEYAFTIPASFTTATNYIIFKGVSQYGDDCFLDDVTVNHIAPCSGTPTAGTTVASATTNVCSATPVTFTLSGSTFAGGLTYQWQSGASATGPWTNIGSTTTTPTLTMPVTTTQYYRAVVYCGTNSASSTPVQVTVPALFPAGTYTIKPSQPASSTNFQTFSAAISAISCGTSGPVVFNVDSATYNEQVVIPQINTNSATNTITFNGNKATLTFTSTSSASPATLLFSGGDYFRFNNLNIVAAGASYAYALHLWNGSDYNIFTNCNISTNENGTASGQVPFSISGSATSATTSGLSGSYNEVNNCTISNGYYNTVIYGGTAAQMATNNRVTNSALRNFYFYGSYNYNATGTTIADNDISRPTRTSLSSFYGVYLSSNCLGYKIYRNRIHDAFTASPTTTSSAYCIYILTSSVAGSEDEVNNNAIYNMRNNGSLYGIYLSAYNYINVYHNTVNFDDSLSTGTSSYTIYGIYSSGSNVTIKNNIIKISRTGASSKYGLYFSGTSRISDNNDIYVSSTSGTNYLGYYSGGFSNLTTWQGANNGAWDASSVSVDPQFASPATGNLKPTNLSMDNRGTPVGITVDILRTPRLTPPDVGAYEFGPGCQPVTALSISNVTSTTAALKWAGTVGNSGYEYAIDRNRTEPSGNGTLITDTSNNLSGLRPYTRYYAHVRVKCANGGYSSWITDSFTTVCVTPAAPATATTPTICPNQPVTLRTTGADNLTYQWLLNGNPVANARDSVYLTSTGGVYSVIVNMGTCTKTSDTVRLTVDTSLLARVTYSGSNRICGGGSIRMTVNSGAGYTYQWMKNGNPIPTATASTYTVEYTGVYTVRITAPGHGCAAISDPIPVTVSDNPVPQIARNGATLSTTRAFATYQWYYGIQPISGATSGTYNFTHDGAYTVVVTDSNGCTGSSSRYMVNFLGIGTVQASEISVYPNPATTSVTIASPVAVNVEIRTVDGKSVLQQQGATTVDIHGLSAGLYLLYISDKDNNVLKVEKLVKNNH